MFFIISFFAFSCNKSPEQVYSNFGLTFTIPANWKIGKELNFEDKSYMIALSERGVSPDGLVTLTRFNTLTDNHAALSKFQKELQGNAIYDHSNLIFEGYEQSVFSKWSTIATSFSFDLLGISFDGIIHVFDVDGHTITIMKQQTSVRQKQNMNAFNTFEQSLQIHEIEKVL